jgi:hypothetical protein
VALFKRSSVGAMAGLGLLAMAAVGGFAAGFNARSGLSTVGARAPVFADMSASDTVSLRFPGDWAEAAPSTPMTLAFASADPGFTLFDPTPIYPAGVDSTASVPDEHPRPTAQSAAPAPAKPVVAAKPTQRSNAVLNESQLSSIKRRLNLTREQERYWPAVEAELRKLEYKKDAKSPQGTRTAAVDTTKVNMEGLKSAGFPLIMSFNDDQRQELKSLAHLLGLESVVSNF